jgi:LDH2 family malate/lactate/ureidoglycolate dehydrogenase
LGGSEDHSSYKGFGLALMVEILSSGLVLGAAGPDVGPLTSSTPRGPADVSHFFMVLDPARFGMDSSFGKGIDMLVERVRGLPSTDPERPVLVPGDPEARHLDERRRSGIPIHSSVVVSLDALAVRLDVPTLSSTGT